MAKAPTKKTARKTTKSATVKKTAVKKTAAKKAVKKAAAPKKTATKKVAPKKTAVKKTAVKKVVAKKAPAKKAVRKKAPVKRKPVVTTVIAKFDAGYGNELYIRGGSSGLTWTAGEVMTNKGADEWVWKSTSVTNEIEFKVLINDEIWSEGSNGVVFPGATVVFEPVF
ncbi:hypothetical protein [Oceanipulchritudo coccoides]|uniref:hypothetical protein n=1 Tax=Oceanipulchritudo coccoides TaxID=2706888 RepID=UPI001EE8ACAF|nr:hypothetical protein [Oceanipulchritudo coccoides]